MIRDSASNVCGFHDASSGCRNEVTRTVWDGANILYDVRIPADTAGDSSEGYPASGTFQGSVGYTHAGGLDTPLDLFKGSTVVVPYADWRGTYDVGTCPTTRCLDANAYFPLAGTTSFGDGPVLPTGPPNWFGEVLAGQTDGSGYRYMRNRYYDPRAGRFTQEDPIGLAGGMNAYGFAAGDPVQFSDPLGLWSQRVHDMLLNKALARVGVSGAHVGWAQQGSAFADRFQGQMPWTSHGHAMRSVVERDAGAARTEVEVEHQTLLNKAKALAEAGETMSAWKAFGEAAHLTMDRTSPWHSDNDGNPQVWDPLTLGAIRHASDEKGANPDSKQEEAAISAVRRDYQYVFGKKP